MPPRKPKHDPVVGDDQQTASSKSLTTQGSVELAPEKEAERMYSDILIMYESGVHPRDIARRYPLYSVEQILELCHSHFDLSAIDMANLDTIFMRGFLRDMVDIKQLAESTPDLYLKLNALQVLQHTRERATVYAEKLQERAPKPSDDANDKIPVIETITERIKAKVNKFKTLPERQDFINKIQRATEEELSKLLDGEDDAIIVNAEPDVP